MAKANVPVRIGVMLLAIAYLLCALLISGAWMALLVEWQAISAAFATITVIWMLCSAVMFIGAAWLLASLGRNRIPMWSAGGATALAGLVWVGGVLAKIIPCSGPA